jgi:hypothetical protein
MADFFDRRTGELTDLAHTHAQNARREGKRPEAHKGRNGYVQPHNSLYKFDNGCNKCHAQVKAGTHPQY